MPIAMVDGRVNGSWTLVKVPFVLGVSAVPFTETETVPTVMPVGVVTTLTAQVELGSKPTVNGAEPPATAKPELN